MSSHDPIDSNREPLKADRDIADEQHAIPADAGEDDPTSAIGGLGGAAVGAAAGSLAGPLGIVVGAMAGGVGGWWAGRAISHAAHEYDESSFRERHAPHAHRHEYEVARPAYQLGYLAGRNPDYRERTFEDVEEHVMLGWTPIAPLHGPWPSVRDYARHAYGVGQEHATRLEREVPITRSRETSVVADRGIDASSESLDDQLAHADEDPIAHPAEPAEVVYPSELDALANGVPAEPGSEVTREFGISAGEAAANEDLERPESDVERESTDELRPRVDDRPF